MNANDQRYENIADIKTYLKTLTIDLNTVNGVFQGTHQSSLLMLSADELSLISRRLGGIQRTLNDILARLHRTYFRKSNLK